MKNTKSLLLIAFSLSIAASTQAQHDFYEGGLLADGTENPAAITDGNPASITGQTSREVVNQNAIPDPVAIAESYPEMVGEAPAETTSGPASVGFILGRGSYTAGDTDGDVNSLAVPYSHKVNERLSLNLSLPLYYTRIKDADFSTFPPTTLSVWGGGLLVSGAYGVAIPTDNKSYRWKVTPTVGLTWMDASGADVGSWSVVGGLSSNLLFKVGDKLILNIGNSLTAYHSQKLRSNYATLGNSEQALLVNGLQLIYPLDRWVFNAFVIDNRYLNDAAVDSYQTYGLGGGYRIGKKTSIRLYYYTDQGHDYQAHSVGLSSAWKF